MLTGAIISCGRSISGGEFAAEMEWHKLRSTTAVTLRTASDADCVDLAATMRAVDINEAAATGAACPLEALRSNLSASTLAVTAADSEGRIICMFGVAPAGFLTDGGRPWLFCSGLIEAHRREFARLSAAYVAAMLKLYPWLEGLIDASNDAGIRHLERLGFYVGKPLRAEFRGHSLRPFDIRK